jgi:hypothetical protein
LLMNVNQWNIFCSQKLRHCMLHIPVTLSPYTASFLWLWFRDLYWQSYETSHKRMWKSN